jgi:membrane-associated phospholipid phosphatase
VVQAALPVFAFAALSMVAIDPAVALLMKSHVAGGFERVMRVVSDFGIGTGYIVVAAIGLVAAPILRRAKLVPLREAMLAKLQRFSLLALLGFAASGAVVNLTKLLVGRHRPRDLFDHAQYGFEPFRFLHGVDGFPSGHSQTIFVVATVLSLAMPKYWRVSRRRERSSPRRASS